MNCVHVYPYQTLPVCMYTCNSCNTGTRALPDTYARLPKGHRPESRGHTYQAKPERLVLQLICNIYQADSLYRAINHISQ